LWFGSEEGIEGYGAVSLRERVNIGGDDLGVAGRELMGQIEFVGGLGVTCEELIHKAHTIVAAGGTCVEREGAVISSGSFRDLSGAKEDVAGKGLDLRRSGLGSESVLGCGKSLGELIAGELGADEAGVGSRGWGGCELSSIEGLSMFGIARDKSAEGFTGSRRSLNGAEDFAVCCGGMGSGRGLGLGRSLGEGDGRQRESSNDKQTAHEGSQMSN
jgi:hypothetical protein